MAALNIKTMKFSSNFSDSVEEPSEMMDNSIQTPDDGIVSLSPPRAGPRPGNIDFSTDGKLSESGQLCVTQALGVVM